MYKTGMLKFLDPPCNSMDKDGFCDEWGEGHKHLIEDYHGCPAKFYTAPDFCVFLPHSCDEWIIGGKNEIKTLITDLQKIYDSL